MRRLAKGAAFFWSLAILAVWTTVILAVGSVGAAKVPAVPRLRQAGSLCSDCAFYNGF